MPTELDHSSEGPRPLRRDAQRNRDAVLAAARQIFTRHGLQAPLEWIAREAEVGISTLYRHYPTRLDLIEAVVSDKLEDWISTARRALAVPDAWQGLVYYLEEICRRQTEDRGFTDLASMRFPDKERLEDGLRRAHELTKAIVARAREAGQLREDVESTDLMLILWGLSRVAELSRPVRPDIWRRYLALTLDSLRPEQAHPLPVAVMTTLELATAMAAQPSSAGTTAPAPARD
jgi:AcrR family transcriptional regulator